jgi:hypothetical protein
MKLHLPAFHWLLRLRLLACAAALGVLAACAATHPSGDDPGTALVRFRSDHSGLTRFVEVRLDHCPNLISRVLATTAPISSSHEGERSQLGMWGGSTELQGLVKERRLPAGKETTLHAGVQVLPTVQQPGYTCGMGLSFVPEAGAQYELSYYALRSSCRVFLHRLSIDAQGRVHSAPEPSLRRITARLPDTLCKRPPMPITNLEML